MPPAVAAAVKPDDDVFASAFEQIASVDDAKKDAPAAPVTPVLEGADAAKVAADAAAEATAAAAKAEADKAATDAASVDGETKTPEQIAAEAKAVEDAAAAAAAKAAQDAAADAEFTRRLTGALEKVATPAADTAAQRAAAAAEQERQRQAAIAAQQPQYSEEEKSLVEQAFTDFPDVMKASYAVRREEYRQVVGYVFNEVAQAMKNALKPIEETLGAIAERTHMGDLQSTIPDYATTRDKVVAWVDTQPGYIKAGMQHVIAQGTAEEVRDLVQRYEAANGIKRTPAAEATPAAPAKAAAEAAVKAAAAALAPVAGKRSGATTVTTPGDFDGAFADAAKLLEAGKL